jgi:hypothetical protein
LCGNIGVDRREGRRGREGKERRKKTNGYEEKVCYYIFVVIP